MLSLSLPSTLLFCSALGKLANVRMRIGRKRIRMSAYWIVLFFIFFFIFYFFLPMSCSNDARSDAIDLEYGRILFHFDKCFFYFSFGKEIWVNLHFMAAKGQVRISEHLRHFKNSTPISVVHLRLDSLDKALFWRKWMALAEWMRMCLRDN